MKYNLDIIKKKLEETEKLTLSDVTIDDVDDLNSIVVDKRKPSNERMLDFLNTVRNPYIFKCGDKLVQIGFSNSDKNADDCLTNVLSKLYK